MAQQQRRISDLTIEEFRALMHDILQAEQTEQEPATSAAHPQAGLLDIEPVSVGDWQPGWQLISREEYYDDDR